MGSVMFVRLTLWGAQAGLFSHNCWRQSKNVVNELVKADDKDREKSMADDWNKDYTVN